MNIIKAHNLACPIDGEPLLVQNKQMMCQQGHSFDIARQGYAHLLPVQHKRSKQPGDSKEMVIARTLFLNSGHYAPIAKRLAEITRSLLTDKGGNCNNESCIMDAGCGEGYYTDIVTNTLMNNDSSHKISLIGLDISKEAIVEAAKRNKLIMWLVGTNRQPPVQNASVDIILCVFGFLSFEGFNQILKSGGKIILVDPGPAHLKELREIIYKNVKKSAMNDLSVFTNAGFSLENSESLVFKTSRMNKDQINQLLLMTPHFFRVSKAGREAINNIEELVLTVDIVFRTLKKQ